MGANFNQAGLWTEGDGNYDAFVDIDDFGFLAANFNGPQLRPVRPDANDPGVGVALGEAFGRIAEEGSLVATDRDLENVDWRRFTLYLAMLDHPQIYWEAYDRPDIWRWFAPYELLDLGVTIPERPIGFSADGASVPEPALAGAVVAATALIRRRR